ncbi:MAG TPA: DUF6519 domain-containing protein [Thermoanaerobaculia bacterium]
MKGDFSRVTFDPRKNFTRVLMQQGRVQLDADWNEQAAILLHYLQTLAKDLIGPHGGPEEDWGFEIVPVTSANRKLTDLTIGKGRYYVDGLLCENTGGAEDVLYSKQPSFLEPEALPDRVPLLAYLDVWERHITYVQDDGIREVALGGPDTATRAQLVWQVRVTGEMPDGNAIPADATEGVFGGAWEEWVESWQPANRGSLKARAKMDGEPTELCTASPDARYRGAENQLYRVEIQWQERDDTGKMSSALTFKWSRENGSVIFPVRGLKGLTAQLESLGRDEATGLKQGDWVELVDDVIELSGKPGPLLKVAEIDAARATVTLARAENDNIPMPEYEEDAEARGKHALLRRWDHRESAFKKDDVNKPMGGVLFTFGQGGDGWITLEQGIQIQLQPGAYRPGDYWLIPARTATGDVEWPGTTQDPQAVPPHGVEHHYAPLGLLSEDAGRGGFRVTDLRKSFEYLA